MSRVPLERSESKWQNKKKNDLSHTQSDFPPAQYDFIPAQSDLEEEKKMRMQLNQRPVDEE